MKIQIWSDYVCPFCLLAKGPIQEAVAGRDVEIEWMPFELRPEPVPTLEPEGDYLQNIWKQTIYPMAERMGVGIHLPDVSPQPYTRLAFEGYQYAREHGDAEAYNDRLLRAFFEDGLDIGDLDVLADLAAELGLDAEEFRAALLDGRYGEAHRAALQQAQDLQIRSVPTIIVDGTYRIEGVPRPDALREVLDRLEAIKAVEASGKTSCGVEGC
ncbi:DsbA family oxidoreductase [Nonomuraea sp. NPDC049725]|uniref:DsbA family oxidoreductase n=1 Tax=Nonomuraea sp. NPDC049725 TaxID=3154508 RepID=UPI0034236255